MLARVIARHGHRYHVRPLDGPVADFDAVARGRHADVVAGDLVRLHPERDLLVIESVQKRDSLLFRSDANRVKPLAANVHQVAIVFAPQPTPQLDFLWRALIAAHAGGIGTLAIRNKSDLADDRSDAMLAQIAALGSRTACVSARTDPAGTLKALWPELDGRATVMVGQSGMGKSSLSNLLLGTENRTGELTRRGTHGRQTTTTARWFDFASPHAGALVDSPGFQAFGLSHLSAEQLLAAMPDLADIPGSCRFANCRHDREPGCRIVEAVTAGNASGERHAFYLRLVGELSASRQIR